MIDQTQKCPTCFAIATGPSDVEVVTADALENSRSSSSSGEWKSEDYRGRGTDDVDASSAARMMGGQYQTTQ